ncbi:MAG: ATP synthase F1 subunit epsilon [Erysipelotrichaceae bacterium]
MLHVKIITPKGLYHETDCISLHATSVEGEFTLLSDHMSVVAMLVECPLIINDGTTDSIFAISKGLLHLLNNNIEILVDAIEGKSEIDIPRALAAKKRAEERLSKRDSSIDNNRVEIALHKAINRIDVANK